LAGLTGARVQQITAAICSADQPKPAKHPAMSRVMDAF
jgi:hypothetical protein